MKPSRGPNPERIGRPEPNCCPETHYEAPEAPQREGSGPRRARTRGPGGCAASRRPSACAASVRRKPLEDVGVAAQIHPAHAPGLVEMGIGALQPFAALPQQASPAGTPNAPPVAIHRGARRPFTLPTASPAVRLRHVAAKPQGRPTQPTSRCCDTPCPRPPLRYHHPPARPPQPARPRSPASRPSSSYRRHSQPTRTAMTSRKIVRSNALFARIRPTRQDRSCCSSPIWRLASPPKRLGRTSTCRARRSQMAPRFLKHSMPCRCTRTRRMLERRAPAECPFMERSKLSSVDRPHLEGAKEGQPHAQRLRIASRTQDCQSNCL